MWIKRDLLKFLQASKAPVDLTVQQMQLLNSLEPNIVDKWIISSAKSHDFAHARVVCLNEVASQLAKIMLP